MTTHHLSSGCINKMGKISTGQIGPLFNWHRQHWRQGDGGGCTQAKAVCQWMTDNGSYYTASDTRSFAKELSLKYVTMPVTSPQSKGIAESFVKTLKRDYAKLANRPDSKTVMAQLKDWFDDYNSYHPHSALGYLPPTLFSEKRSVT